MESPDPGSSTRTEDHDKRMDSQDANDGDNHTRYRLGFNEPQHAGLRGWLDRLRADFRLAIVAVFSLVAAVIVFPFAVFRAVTGAWQVALFDLAIVIAITALPVLGWRFERSESAGKLMAVIISASALAAVVVFKNPYLWVFPVLVANFLLSAGRFATVLSTVMVGVVFVQSAMFADAIEAWTFLAVSALVALLSFTFAYRSSIQHNQLSMLAQRDPLTGVGNRRAMRHDLTRVVTLDRTGAQHTGLAVLDLDNFKRINDAYGHDSGDRILVELTEIIRATMRGDDRCYRFGGDEFVLLLSGTGADGLQPALNKLIERIRTELESPEGPMTVSIGATDLRAGDTPQSWLARADQALYRAKENGRDRVEFV